jgi:hypothetical protein
MSADSLYLRIVGRCSRQMFEGHVWVAGQLYGGMIFMHLMSVRLWPRPCENSASSWLERVV